MKIKHSKFRNTGLIFELLIRQIAVDTLSDKGSPAIQILKKFYGSKSPLSKEYKLYELAMKYRGISREKAEAILQVITESSRKLDQSTIKRKKYELISEIGKHYKLEDFFGMQVRDYKPLAALYCLLEAQNSVEMVDPSFLVGNRVTILEHITSRRQSEDVAKESLIEEYSKFDKDLRLLTYKIMLEKFNSKYQSLLPEQKFILKEFILSVDSTPKLRTVINTEIGKIVEGIQKYREKVTDEIVGIKLEEVQKLLVPVSPKEKVTDNHLVRVMQCYDLVNELKSL